MTANLTVTEADRVSRFRYAPALVLKFAVMAACFWYISRKFDFTAIGRAGSALDFRWFGLAVLVIVVQIPLVAVRWSQIVDALAGDAGVIRRGPMLAINAISTFFGQVLANIAGDTMRVWLLTRLDRDWWTSLTSVLIDRAAGVAALLFVGFLALSFPASGNLLGEQRAVLLATFGALLVFAGTGLVAAQILGPVLQRWKITRWIGDYAIACYHVLLGAASGLSIIAISVLVQSLMAVSVWLLARAQGLSLSALDAAVLSTIMVGASIIPLSIGGWGIREVVIGTLLHVNGIPLEQVILLSMCFGFAVLAASLPGVVIWTLYSPPAKTRVRR